MKFNITKILLPIGGAMLVLCSCSQQMQVQTPVEPLTASVAKLPQLRTKVVVGDRISGNATASYLFGIKISGDPVVTGINVEKSANELVDNNGIKLLTLKDLQSSEYADLHSTAAHKAVQASGADVLVAPRATTKVKRNFLYIYKKVDTPVDGFKGTITGFEEIKEEKQPQVINTYNMR